jgi:hypothetical protein
MPSLILWGETVDPAFEESIKEQVEHVRTAKRGLVQAKATGDLKDIPPAQQKVDDAYATYLALCQKALVRYPLHVEDI